MSLATRGLTDRQKSSRDIIIPRFPEKYDKYVEGFGGAGWILFAKPVGNEIEIYNDGNSNLSNLYYCVREHSEELKKELTYVLNSREDFDSIKGILNKKAEMGDVKTASFFYQLIRYSYASGCDSYAGKPHSMWSNFPIIDLAAGRLQKVVIECRDFEKLIKIHDSKTTFFYLDPPYIFTEAYYNNVAFTSADHLRFAELLKHINGYFLLSYNDCPEARKLYDGYYMYSYERLSNMSQRFEGGAMFKELLIANYDMSKRIQRTSQINFFNDMEDFTNGIYVQ